MSTIKLWKNKGKILEGLKNKIFKNKHVEEIFQERLTICNKCPNLDLKGDYKLPSDSFLRNEIIELLKSNKDFDLISKYREDTLEREKKDRKLRTK